MPDVFDLAAQASGKRVQAEPIPAHAVRDVFDMAEAQSQPPSVVGPLSVPVQPISGRPAPSYAPEALPQATISARKPGLVERGAAMFREAVPQFSTKTVYHPTYGRGQLIEPEAALTPTEQARHPIATGVAEFAGGLTSAENTAILAATGGLGTLPGAAGRIIPRLVSAGFSAMMIKGVYDQVPEFKRAMDEGKESEALRIITHMVLGGGMATLAAAHAAGAKTPMLPAYLERRSAAPVSARPALATEAAAAPKVEARPEPPKPAVPAVVPKPPVEVAPKVEAPAAKPDVFDQAAAPGLPAVPEAAREPWQMTKAEYRATWDTPEFRKKFPNYRSDQDHAAKVAEAVDTGKPVPPEVLAEYPDLKPAAAPKEPWQKAVDRASDFVRSQYPKSFSLINSVQIVDKLEGPSGMENASYSPSTGVIKILRSHAEQFADRPHVLAADIAHELTHAAQNRLGRFKKFSAGAEELEKPAFRKGSEIRKAFKELAVAEAPAPREPWQMTREEFKAALPMDDLRIRKQADGRYYASFKGAGEFATGASREEATQNLIERRRKLGIELAAEKGLPVPREVLAEYPELTKAALVEPPPAPKAEAAPSEGDIEFRTRTAEQRAKEQDISDRVFGKGPDIESIVRTHLEKLAKGGKYGVVGANEKIWKELPIETKKLGGERVAELVQSVFTETHRKNLAAEAKKFPVETTPRAVEPYEKPPVRPDIDSMSREELTAELPNARNRIVAIRDEIAKYGPSPDRTKLGEQLQEAYDWVGKVDRTIKFREQEATKQAKESTQQAKPKVAGGLAQDELESLTTVSGVSRADVQSLIDRGFAKVTKKGFGDVVFIEPTTKGQRALNEFDAKAYERKVAAAHELRPDAARIVPPSGSKQKADFQREYFVDALKPVQKAWVKAIKDTDTPLGNELVGTIESGAKLDKAEKSNLDRFAKERPEAFKENQLHIKVPGDGEFLLYNNPSVVVQAMADAKGMFTPSKGADYTLKPQRISKGGPTEVALQSAIKRAEAGMKLAENQMQNPDTGHRFSSEFERDEWVKAERENIQTMKDTLAEGTRGPKGPSGTAYGEPYEQRAGRVVLPKVQQVNAPRELIGKGEIVRQLSEGLDKLPIRVGHFKQKALGIYKPKEESVRLLKALDIQTTFHEAGHHINKLLWGTYSKATDSFSLNWKPLTPFRSELKPPNFGYRPSGRSYLPESFADFIAAYVIDPATAKAKAPKFYDFFEKEVARMPDVREVLENSRANVLRWLEQPAQARILAHISKEETRVPQNRFDRVMAATVDALRPLQNVVNELAKGQKVPTEQNAYELARLLAGWAGKAEHFLERGTFKAESLEVTGKSLKAILKPFEGKLDNLRVYLTAKRAVEKAAQGKASGLEVDDMVTVLKDLETPEMQKVAQELYDYNDATLLYLKDSGYFSNEQYTQIRSMNQNYVPFYRVMEEAAGGVSRGGGKTMADLWNPVKRMKGSGREIIDPLESIVKNTYTFINLAERNRVAQALAKQADSVEGAGKWIEKIPGPQKMTKFTLEEIKKALIDAGVEVTMSSRGTALLGEGGKELDLDTVAMVFRPSSIVPKGENILTVRENGKTNFYQVHPELYRSLKALDQDQSNILVKILSAPARLLRLGATGLSPEFIIRNPVRDAWTAWLQSKNGFIPGVDSLRGLFHALKKDDLYWEWKRAGGEHAALVAMDRTTLQGELKDLLRSPLSNVVHHPIEAARQLSEWTEAATRLGEYGKAIKGGKTPRQAALESREVTVDFARIGNSTRAVNSIIAFWNAAVQGTDKFARTHIENPRRAVVTGLVAITLPRILLYMANRKDKNYQELPRWQKDFFFIIPTGNQNSPFIRVPNPFLWGMVYGSTVERTLEWIDKRDPHAFDELFGNIATSAGPSLVPTAAVPIIEAYANRSMFRDAPLDPRYLEKVTPEYRVTDRTSLWSQKTAFALAKMGIHVSPNKLDNALFGYTGGLGSTAVRATDMFIGREKKPSTRVSDIPMLRGFAVSKPGRESQSVQQFYDRLEELEQKQGTLAYDRKYPGRLTGPPEMPLEEKQELYRLRYANQQMQLVNQQIRRASSDPKLSPDEKRKKLDELNARAVAITRRALRKEQSIYHLDSLFGRTGTEARP